ncbi:carbonic anhydrase Nec1-like [Lotus japonicus]|uniref:carbonic anhydrase Nec1-like n=1 Tax=Lotus japonicus TaxID=34305 RepID=UPI002586E4D6|nr:carbonic anhydrase Nec1-like [Lotus japonicus]
MKLQRENIYALSTLLMLLMILFGSTSIRAQEVEDEREFDYIKGSEKGPLHWGELKEEWAACKHGDMQSPIDLSNGRVKMIPYSHQLKTNYRSSNATLRNRGHDIAVYWMGDAGSISINGTEFFLQQCHWHSPSEHSINGRNYDIEMHMIHVSPDPKGNKIAVVGALYKMGHPDPFLAQLVKDIKHIEDEEREIVIGHQDPSQIQTKGKIYYRYVGSLTTPPCTEGVIWNIDRKIRTVSKEQVKLLREAVHDHAEMNARPRQPHNNRDIHLHQFFPFKPKN